MARITKKEANDRFAGFMHNHIIAGQFWDDESYEEDIVALAVLGYADAIEACKRNGYSRK